MTQSSPDPAPTDAPRVLRIIPSIDPEVGGPSFHLVNAAVAEARGGAARVVVAATRRPGQADPPGVAELAAEGVGYVSFPRPRIAAERMLRWGVSPRQFAWILRNARDFDVLHVDFVWSVGGVAAAIAGRLWGRPVVLTPHESLTTFGIATSRSPRRARQKLAVRRALLAGVHTVVVSSALEARDSALEDVRHVVVSHPIDGRPDPAPARREAPAPGAGLTVGFLGRLHEKKRLDVLLEAVASLPDVRLVVAGGEPAERLAELRAQVAAAPWGDRVELRGFVAAAEREAFLADVDVLAMPSDYECFGMAAAEAMTAGVPVLVSDHVGIADVVARHGAGVVVPRRDPGAVATALHDLARDPQRLVAHGRAGEAASRAEFSFAAYGRAIGAVYRSITAGTTRRIPRMPTASLRRRLRQGVKLARLVQVPLYRDGLRAGVAAAVEHERAALPDRLATVVDVGANRGQFALLAAHRWPAASLVCFEPLPEPRGALQKALAGHRRLRVVDAAVSDAEGTAEFHVSRSDDCSSLLQVTDRHIETFPDSAEVGTVGVRTVRLDAELGGERIERPALLKLDIQGAELEALRGAVGVLDRFDAILVECSFAELYAGQALVSDVIRFLDQHGFVLTSMGAPSDDAQGRTLQADLVFGPATAVAAPVPEPAG